MKIIFLTIVAAVPALLSACGGGGSDSNSEPVASSDTFQLRKAWVNYIEGASSKAFTVSGNISFYPISGSGVLTSGALLSGSFKGDSVLSKTLIMTGEIKKPPETIPIGYSKTFYVDTNYNYLGSEGVDYRVATYFNIPATAKVHAAGILYKEKIYQSRLSTVEVGTSTVSYVLEPDTSSTVLLKLVQDNRDVNGEPFNPNTAVFRITPTGEITRVSEFSVSSGDLKDGLNDVLHIKY